MDMDIMQRISDERDTFSILETLDVFSGERTVLKEFEDVIEAPNWTKDGQHLVYNSLGRIFTYELKSGEIKEIPSGLAVHCNNDHVLSADGRQIAVSNHSSDDGNSRIYRLPFAGGTPTLVTEKGSSYLHGWSPDGRRLAYCAERNGQYDIYTISVDGGAETQLTNLPGLDDGPEYSPDGRFLWFNSTRTGLMQVWRMGTDGTDPTHMVKEEANCWFPHVSPDNNWVVYIAYKKGDVAPGDHPANKNVELRLVAADGGESKGLVQLFGGQGTLNVNSWSPDSRRIAFVSYKPKH